MNKLSIKEIKKISKQILSKKNSFEICDCFIRVKILQEDGCVSFFICDAEDWQIMHGRAWHLCNGYAYTNTKIRQKIVKHAFHRLVTNAKDHEVVYHLNGDKLDNRKANLRKTTK